MQELDIIKTAEFIKEKLIQQYNIDLDSIIIEKILDLETEYMKKVGIIKK